VKQATYKKTKGIVSFMNSYYIRSQIYDIVDFFESFDHSSYSKYLF
jgi:hypothetical protein